MSAFDHIRRISYKYKFILRLARSPSGIFVYRMYMRLLCWYVSLSDSKNIKRSGFGSLPPAPLRHRVNGDPNIEVYLKNGKLCAQGIEGALTKIGMKLDSFEKVLDFGCGCGRSLIWFSGRQPEFYGTDIDNDAITWCRENIDFARFSVNKGLPPLEYTDGNFDFIYSISVLTHLNEDYQFNWLKELKRILKPCGILMVTVQGRQSWERMLPEHLTKLQKTGFLHITTNDLKGIFPSWYQVTHHTKEYVLDKFSYYFKVVEYMENVCQDLVILQNS